MKTVFEISSKTPYDEEEIICWMEFSKMNGDETFTFLRVCMTFFPNIEGVISMVKKYIEIENMGAKVKHPIIKYYKKLTSNKK